MNFKMYQVDAFTDTLFAGNPAAVCILGSEWLPDDTMQQIAAENNLAETAFVVGAGKLFDQMVYTDGGGGPLWSCDPGVGSCSVSA